jgi:hypothetical protein
LLLKEFVRHWESKLKNCRTPKPIRLDASYGYKSHALFSRSPKRRVLSPLNLVCFNIVHLRLNTPGKGRRGR